MSINDKEIHPVHFSDSGIVHSQTSQIAVQNVSSSFSPDLSEIMSKSALESWLGEQSSSSSEQTSQQLSSARVSTNDLHLVIKPNSADFLILLMEMA